MMYPYCKYADETEVVFSHIMKNEKGEEIIHVHFERPTEQGFDSVRFELPSCKILYKDGNYKEEEIEFNTYFNIEREDEEVVNYSIIINEPTIDMYNIKALLIHDYYQEEAFPSVGIFDNEVELQKDSEDTITLSGVIQTTEDISDVNFKLYLEYQDDNGLENKIYYAVARG